MINKDTYKRLTNKKGDHTTVSGSNCPKETKRGYFCDKENCKLRITRECPFLKSFDRLAELEDKIENGTLVELPCKVGDTVYEVFKDHRPPFIQETTIEKIVITEKGFKLRLSRNSFYETAISSLGKTLFLTESEAEAKLKELQEGKK